MDIPEIVAIITGYLHEENASFSDQADLLNCMLLNRLWHDQAARVIFSHGSSELHKIIYLAHRTKERQVHYARYFRTLDIELYDYNIYHRSSYSVLKELDIQFTGVTKVTLHLSGDNQSEFSNLIQSVEYAPNVQNIYCHHENSASVHLSIEFLKFCTSPKAKIYHRIRFARHDERTSVDELATFLRKQAILEFHYGSLQHGVHSKRLFHRVLLPSLIQNPQLEVFSTMVDLPIPSTVLNAYPESVIFPGLKDFKCGGSAPFALSRISGFLENLKVLKMTVTDTEWFGSIASQGKQLAYLQLYSDYSMEAELLKDLTRSLSRLDYLSLNIGNHPMQSRITWGDDDMNELARNLPNIRDLSLHLPAEPGSLLSIKTLMSLYQYCKELRGLDLGINGFDANMIDYSGLQIVDTFENLTTLYPNPYLKGSYKSDSTIDPLVVKKVFPKIIEY